MTSMQTLNKLVFLTGATVLVSACAQTPDAKTRYGSAPETVICCVPTPPPPPCGVYVPCQPPIILQPAPPVVEYVPETTYEYEPAPLPEPPIYVEPEPAPPVYVEPEPELPVYEPPQSWPEPATPPPVWLPRK